MKTIKFINNIKNFNKYKKEKHIYFGSETCEKKLFRLNDLKNIVSKNNKQKITLVFPYLTPKYFDEVKKMFPFISLHRNIFCEVVFNDWGTFILISQYKNLKPVLGRLLNKQRKDPIVQNILDNTQPKMKFIVENNKQILITAKSVPKTLIKYFQHTFLDVSFVQDFMLKNNINRYELDLLPWGTKLNINKKIKLSIYYPYVAVSTTRYCGAINLDYDSKCNRICEKQKIVTGENSLDYPYVIFGNENGCAASP